MSPDTFEDLLDRAQTYLLDLVRRQGGGLLRFESAEDLAQSINQKALVAADGFDYQGDGPFRAWLSILVRRHIADRYDYWTAHRRGSGKVLRLTFGGGNHDSTPAPASTRTGPGTVASRRELLVLSARALAALPDRDQKLVRWMSEGLPIGEQAERLELSYAATQKAGLRAVDRFRKAFQIVAQASNP